MCPMCAAAALAVAIKFGLPVAVAGTAVVVRKARRKAKRKAAR